MHSKRWANLLRRTRTRVSRAGTNRRRQIEPLEPRHLLCGSSVCITEFMAANTGTLVDFEGDSSDWLELHNNSAVVQDLTGWYLTDDPDDLTKWQFPAAAISQLSVGEYQVVFASDKSDDPAVPADELHTNFKLAKGGEYLALVRPDGVTVAHEYAPAFPAQLDDVSYGLSQTILLVDTLVSDDALARVHVPTSDALEDSWIDPGFSDNAWMEVPLGIGFDTTAAAVDYAIIDVGLSGQRVEPGAQSVSAAGNNVNLAPTQLTSLGGDAFTVALDNVDAAGTQVGQIDWRDRGNGSNDPLVALGEDLAKNNAGVIRVTLGSLPAGSYDVVSYHLDADFDQSDQIRIFVTDAIGTNVQQLAIGDASVAAGGIGGVTTSVVVGTQAAFSVVSNGTDEVVIYFDGRAAFDTEVPLSGLRLIGQGSPYEGLIETDIGAQMIGISTSAYVRIPFSIADPAAYTAMSLRAHYDDGFAAYLNGTEIARRNAPATLAFNSAAAASHPDAQAAVAEVIDVSAFATQLVAGENVLAIHGLDALDGENDFLLGVELIADRTESGGEAYFTTPTPGAANIVGSIGVVEDTTFSVDRGFFYEPFQVQITSDTPDAQIRYTTDGSAPTATTGFVYSGPIDITSTTTLRAAAYKPGLLATNVDTQSYIFLDDVLQQSEAFGKDGSGLPPFPDWGHAGGSGDWEVDPEIVNHPDIDNRLSTSDLRSVPTLSLVLPWEDMFGGGGQGIYIQGEDVERAVSVEQILPDGSTGFQIDASVEIVGGSSTNRWKSDKLSMRLKFTEEFGPTKLNVPIFGPEAADSFDTIVLDATLNFSWTHPDTGQTDFAKFIQDQHVANLQQALGGEAPHARYHHLYINGLYWGLYYVHERPDDSFAASYLGGDKDDYDVIKHQAGNVVSGTAANYDAMLALSRQNLAVEDNYDALAEVLDIDDFIDYMLVNFYVGNTDWAHQNWYATYNRVDPSGKWRFHSWDAEKGHINLNDDVTGNDNVGGPTEIHQNLRANAEYRLRFADRVQRALFNDGPLTPERAAAEYQRLMDEIDRSIVGESARWGDSRVTTPYTRDDWLDVQNDLLANYFPRRSGTVVSQLRGDALFPSAAADAPIFRINGNTQHGGEILVGDELSFLTLSGTVYYTLDGTDPRLEGGAVAPTAAVAHRADFTQRIGTRPRTSANHLRGSGVR